MLSGRKKANKRPGAVVRTRVCMLVLVKAFPMLVHVLRLVLTKLAFNLEHYFVTVTLWRILPTALRKYAR